MIVGSLFCVDSGIIWMLPYVFIDFVFVFVLPCFYMMSQDLRQKLEKHKFLALLLLISAS